MDLSGRRSLSPRMSPSRAPFFLAPISSKRLLYYAGYDDEEDDDDDDDDDVMKIKDQDFITTTSLD